MFRDMFLPRDRTRSHFHTPTGDPLLGMGRVAYFAKKHKKNWGGGGSSKKFNAVAIKTTVGTSVVNKDSVVLVSTGGGNFVQMWARDLRPNTRVLFNRQSIEIKLSEVEPVLMESPRYRDTFRYLFEHDSSGKIITNPETGAPLPKLRVRLINGLAKLGVVTDSRMNERILYQQPDFDLQQYEAMVRHVSTTLSDVRIKEVERSDSAIRGWLKGDTISPSNFSIYIPLSKINDAFNACSDPNGTFAGNYDLYVNVRRGIMSYISSFTGESTRRKGREGEREENKLSLAPEITLVVNQFVEKVADQFVVALVTGVEEVGRIKTGGGETPDTGLSKGIVTKDPGRREIRMKAMHEIYSQAYEYSKILEEPLLTVIQRAAKDSSPTTMGRDIPASMAALVLGVIRLEHSPNEMDQEYMRTSEKTDVKKARELAERFKEMVDSGEVDKQLGLSSGTVRKAIDIYFRNMNLMPKLFYRAKIFTVSGMEAQFRGDEKARRRFMGEEEKLHGKLIKQYGIDITGSKQYKLTVLRQALGDEVDKLDTLLSTISFSKGLQDVQEFYTGMEISTALSSLGIGQMANIVSPRNFS